MSEPTEMANFAPQLSDPMPSTLPSHDITMLVKHPEVMSQTPVGAMPQPVPAVYAAAPPQQVIVPIQIGPRPVTLDCPLCHQRVQTAITKTFQKATHITALFFYLLVMYSAEKGPPSNWTGLRCLFCTCIPFFMDSFKAVHHECPKCEGFIGTHKH